MDLKEVKNTGKEPWVAVILSIVIPGLGQFYGLRMARGIVMFLFVNLSLYGGLWQIVDVDGNTKLGYILSCIGIASYIFNVFDAFSVIKKYEPNWLTEVRGSSKDPFLALFLNYVVPGIGHFYARKKSSGLIFILAYIAFLTFEIRQSFDMPFYFIIIRNVLVGPSGYDAFRVAKARKTYFTKVRLLVFLLVASGLCFDMAWNVSDKKYLASLIVKGRSCSPTIQDGDILLCALYKRNDIRRGNFVSIRGNSVTDYYNFTKRVVGFEGDTIEIKNGSIYLNGKQSDVGRIPPFKYVSDSSCFYACEGHPFEVPAGYVFVLGDNPELSKDSRQMGPIEKSRIMGVEYKIIWPLSRIGKI